MGDHDNRLPTGEVVDGLHDGAFGHVVECTGGLVEYEQVRIVVKRPGDPDALPLPAGQSNTALADLGVVTVRELAHHEVVEVGDARCPLDRLQIKVLPRHTERDVGSDRVIGKEDALGNVAYRAPPRLQIGVVDRLPVDEQLPRRGLEEAKNQVDDRRLSRARRADEGDG